VQHALEKVGCALAAVPVEHGEKRERRQHQTTQLGLLI